MVEAHTSLPCLCFCMRRGKLRTPPHHQQFIEQSYGNSFYTDESNNSIEMNFKAVDDQMFEAGGDKEEGNRVMVVVDSSLEAKGAFQWTLSHTLQSQDTVVLLHLTKPSKTDAKSEREKAHELLSSMKDVCQMTRPGVHVEIAVADGKEKGPTIVAEAKQQRVSLLVLGGRKESTVWRLQWRIWGRKRTDLRSKVVEHCIQHAHCMTIAVRRKSRSCGGGYLITTKRHKNFWLLA